jgi:indole-3-glycerol phosphate synthase
MNSILQRIAEHKAHEVSNAKKHKSLASLIQHCTGKTRDFIGALHHQATPAVIAEIKKASPSKGVIRQEFNVAEIAYTYETHGARCLSVLTDEHFFQGHPDYLAQAKAHCSLPALRKDFIIDPYQIYESRVLGADCILLIVAMLDDSQLIDYCQLAHSLEMAVLVESHTEEELHRALRLPTPLIGINNRSLHTFDTDIQLSIDLKHLIPPEKIIITESGISTHDDVLLMQSHGINTFLIGEHLMKAPDIGEALDKLLGKSK